MIALESMTLEELERELDYCNNKIAAKENEQLAFKILLNSLYGGLASPAYRLFETWMAEGITVSGRSVIRTAERCFNEYLDSVIGIKKDRVCIVDTDSCYLNVGDVVDKILPGVKDETKIVDFIVRLVDSKLQPVVNASFAELGKRMNVYHNKMDMKREAIGPAIVVQKKRYVMRVYDSEGVRFEKPKLKVMGLDAVRSNIPAWCRDKLKYGYEKLFTCSEQDIIDFVESTKKSFMNLPYNTISTGSSVQEISKWLDHKGRPIKGTPIHVKAAIAYNQLVEKLGLQAKYPKIEEGDKIKFIKLKTPSPLRDTTAIAFVDTLPKEFNLDHYLDLDELFVKNFKEPLSRVANAVGYEVETSFSVDSWFS